MKGEFDGWDEDARDAKVKVLAAIVKRHVLYKTHLLVSQPDFDTALKPVLPKKLRNAYVFAFNRMISSTAHYEKYLGRSEPIECIFDKQQKIGKRSAKLYERVVGLPGFEASHLVRLPVRFEDEKEFLPLQAADLVAWHFRRRYSNPQEPKRPVYEMLSKPLRENFTYKLKLKELTAMSKVFTPSNIAKFNKALGEEDENDV